MTGRQQGSRDVAGTAWIQNSGYDWDSHLTNVGRGEDRTAWRDTRDDIVYKIPARPSRRAEHQNEFCHEILSEATRRGYGWALPTTLYRITDQFGEEVTVLALPYVANDGSEPSPAALAELAATVDQWDSDNAVVDGGQVKVFDGCSVRLI